MSKSIVELDGVQVPFELNRSLFPEAASGWLNGEYHPRRPQNVVIEHTDLTKPLEIKSHAWREKGVPLGFDANTSGIFDYNETTQVILNVPNQNYHVSLEICNPLPKEQSFDVLINGLVEQVITLSGQQQNEVSFDVGLSEEKFILTFAAPNPATACVDSQVTLLSLTLKTVVRERLRSFPTIYIASDSTVQSYDVDEYPQTGWGERLYRYFKTETLPVISAAVSTYKQAVHYQLSNIAIENRSLGGRSSKSFIQEKRFEQLLLRAQKGDYLLIQWAANDATKARPNRYVSPKHFEHYLSMYVSSAQARGIKPILITPPGTDRVNEDGKFSLSFSAYRPVFEKVSHDYKCLLLDLGRKSVDYLNALGPDAAGINFLQLDRYNFPNFLAGIQDKVHFQRFGAEHLAEFVAELLQQNIPALADKIISQPVINKQAPMPVAAINAEIDVIRGIIRLDWQINCCANFYLITRVEDDGQVTAIGTTTLNRYNVPLGNSRSHFVYQVQACVDQLRSTPNKIEIQIPDSDINQSIGSPVIKVVSNEIDHEFQRRLVKMELQPVNNGLIYSVFGQAQVDSEPELIDSFDSHHVQSSHYYSIPSNWLAIFCEIQFIDKSVVRSAVVSVKS